VHRVAGTTEPLREGRIGSNGVLLSPPPKGAGGSDSEHAALLGRQRGPRRPAVVDLREYEDVVAELAHRKLEIAFGQVQLFSLVVRMTWCACLAGGTEANWRGQAACVLIFKRTVAAASKGACLRAIKQLVIRCAAMQEREVIMRHTLAKGKERYLQLQQRLTRIENSMYGRAHSTPGKGASKR
jgi:hypothetical protein